MEFFYYCKLMSLFSTTHLTSIQNNLTTSLVEEAPPSSYKFIVNSVIIQHEVVRNGEAGLSRGMHSASGAYWNDEKDGSWSYTLEGSQSADEKRDFDIVIVVSWISVS
jgi:hypothetical protein